MSEPFGYFKAEPFGWTDCAETDEGAVALYERPLKPTGIEAMVCNEIAMRQQKGIAKYQTTVADNNLSLREWLQHQYEELLDAAVYCRRAIAEIDKQSSQPSPDEIIAGHAKRLAMDLECMLLASDPGVAVNRWWAEAQTSLDNYKTDIDRLYPQDHVSPLGKD